MKGMVIMKINNLVFNKLQQEYKKDRKSEKIRAYHKGDSMKISSKAKQIKELEILLREIPDVRKEKVENIKRQMESGRYTVDSRAVARKILSSLDKE